MHQNRFVEPFTTQSRSGREVLIHEVAKSYSKKQGDNQMKIPRVNKGPNIQPVCTGHLSSDSMWSTKPHNCYHFDGDSSFSESLGNEVIV